MLTDVIGGGNLTHTAGQFVCAVVRSRACLRLEDGMGTLLSAAQHRLAGTDGAAVQWCPVQINLTVVDVLRMDTKEHHSN